MILAFQDHEGDPVAVESASIVGLSVGTLNGPHAAGADVTVTLIWAAGVGQPFMVAAPFAEVLEGWVRAGDTHRHDGWRMQYPSPLTVYPWQTPLSGGAT